MAKETPIKHIKSSVSGNVPAYTVLDYGELAINYADGALFFRDSSDNVIPIASINNNLVAGEYLFSTSTSATDPGSGVFRLNNATRSSATAIYIDQLSNLKTDADPIFKSLVAGDVIVWQDKASAANTVRYRVTAAPTNNTGWWSIPVEWMSETGSLWAANTLVSFTLHRIGTIGTNGLVNDAVTYAKIQNVSAQKILGRVTNSSGDTEEISTTGWSATAKVVMDQSPTIVTPAFTGLPTGTGVASGSTASTLAARDSNANLSADSFLSGYTTTATAAGTTTLTVDSTQYQFFTGTTTQTVTLPVTSTLVLGQTFYIHNNSTGTVTVNSSGGNLVASVPAGVECKCTVILTSGTTAASWDKAFENFQTITGTGDNVLATNPVLVTPNIGTPSAGTLTNCTGLPRAGLTNASALSVIGRSANSSGAPADIAAASTGQILWRNGSTLEFGTVLNNTYISWLDATNPGPTDSTTWVDMFPQGTASLGIGHHFFNISYRLVRTGGITSTALDMRLDTSSTSIEQWGLFVKCYTNSSASETATCATLNNNVLYWGALATNPSTAFTLATAVGDATMTYHIEISGMVYLSSARTITPQIRFNTGSGYTTNTAWGSYWKIDSTPVTYGVVA